MPTMFEVRNINKRYGNTKAVDDMTLQAESGKIFALLGPNGAGKTTLVRMLSTLIRPESGEISVLGIDALKDAQKVREIIGLAGQYAAIDEFQTGYENIYMVGRLYHLPAREAEKRAWELLERLGLAEAANRIVRTYSGGMRRRLDLGASLIGRPKVLFLDEPTTGLDPRTRQDLWVLIRELVREGASILLTTQYLEEADELADHIAVMDNGKIVAEGTSDELKTRFGGDVVELVISNREEKDKAFSLLKEFAVKEPNIDENGTRFIVPVSDGSGALLNIIQSMNGASIKMNEVSLHRPTLDDVFLSLTDK